MFDDVTKLSDGVAYDVLRGGTERVPLCDIFVAGLVCKSVSKENPRRAFVCDCVSAVTRMTGEAW